MSRSLELLRTRHRLRVGARFLTLRPRIVAIGALGNALCAMTSSAPAMQKLALAAALGSTVFAFFAEAAWLKRHPLSERWLLWSLFLTLLVLSSGVALSGGLTSPLLPLVFAPVVVGFAAFARSAESVLLLVVAVCALLVIAVIAPMPAFPPLPSPAALYMLLISTLMSLALLAVGVISLVDAHAQIADELERMRADMLQEAEHRALSVEHLGAQVAHEVKNPLTAVRGLIQLAQRKIEDARDQERLNVAVSEIDRSLELLRGYLTFAKPLADLDLGPVDVRPLLEDVAGVLEARAHEQNVQIEISAESISLLADRRRVRDAVLNLALNAIAAMPQGGKLELRATKNTDLIRILVVDNGAGMSAELLRELGKPFVSEAEGGTGLGVLIAQAVARQHGGTLRFESAPGQGTTAILELGGQARA
jgi:signal transduction histidine kinase